MSRKSKAVAVGSVLFVVLVGTALVAAREKRKMEAELVSIVSARVALQGELQEAERALAELEGREVGDPAAAAPASPQPAGSVPPKAEEKTPRKSLGLVEVSREFPELMELFALSKRAELGRYYGPLFETLGLSPEQIDAFEALQEERSVRYGDIALAADAQDRSVSDPNAPALREGVDAEIKMRERDLLREEGFHALQEYERTIRARGMAHGLAAAVAFSDPLNAEQADQLTQAVAQACESYQAGGVADLKRVDWTTVDQHAREILSPAQFAVWQRGDTHAPSCSSRLNLQLERLYEKAVNEEDSGASGDQ